MKASTTRLVKEILDRIDRLYADTSVEPEDTLEGLRDVQSQLQEKISVLAEEIRRSQQRGRAD